MLMVETVVTASIKFFKYNILFLQNPRHRVGHGQGYASFATKQVSIVGKVLERES